MTRRASDLVSRLLINGCPPVGSEDYLDLCVMLKETAMNAYESPRVRVLAALLYSQYSIADGGVHKDVKAGKDKSVDQ